jgi:hypothetical protein
MFSHQRSGFRRVIISRATAKRETCAGPSGEAALLPPHRAFIATAHDRQRWGRAAEAAGLALLSDVVRRRPAWAG